MTLKPVFLTTVMLVTGAGVAIAQGGVPPKQAVPVPQTNPGIRTKPPSGVVRPPNTDPGMAVPPPRNGAATIIPPPGTPGNNPAIIPK